MRSVTGGSTDVINYFSLELTAGGPATGLTIADCDLTYVRSGSSPAAKVDATALAATNTAHTDNYGIEIDATNQKGLYRFDYPDAAFAAGVPEVILTVLHASCKPAHLRVLIDAPVSVTKWNGTAVATPATAGIPEVNIKNINNVSASAVTTVKAVQGLAVDGVVPTVTNLTNAPTNGDFTAAMKTSAQTAAAAALTAYDPPTNAEMEARTLAAASYATAAGQAEDKTEIIEAVNTRQPRRAV